MKNLQTPRGILWFLLYLIALLPSLFSIFYFSEKNLLPAFITLAIAMSIYTALIFKNVKFINVVSFITLILFSLLVTGILGKQTNNAFPGVLEEKIFMLAQPLLVAFVLVNSVYWTKKRGLKKYIAVVFVSLSVLILATFGTISPNYFQNFVYTRINILILFLFGVYLFVKKRKLLGILEMGISLGLLLLSAGMFAEKTYILEETEQKQVIALVDPIVKEMFDYYNKEDYENFCRHCGLILKNMLARNPLKDKRNAFGPYISFAAPNKVFRKGGRYYIDYPIKFQKLQNPILVTFVVADISSRPFIYGFSFSYER